MIAVSLPDAVEWLWYLVWMFFIGSHFWAFLIGRNHGRQEAMDDPTVINWHREAQRERHLEGLRRIHERQR